MGVDAASKVEFAVNIKGPACVESVKLRLKEIGVKNNEIETVIDSQNKECRLIIQTKEPWIKLQESIESTGPGLRSVLVGFSEEAAVAMLDKGGSNVKGVVRFCSIAKNKPGIVVDGVVDGLDPKADHSLRIHEYGDISQGSSGLGDIYKNSIYTITPDDSGRATIRTVDENLNVSELIGRSIAVSSAVSDGFVFGIISRAAGVFQNWKRICACDGVTIWDERDRPLAGAGRRNKE